MSRCSADGKFSAAKCVWRPVPGVKYTEISATIGGGYPFSGVILSASGNAVALSDKIYGDGRMDLIVIDHYQGHIDHYRSHGDPTNYTLNYTRVTGTSPFSNLCRFSNPGRPRERRLIFADVDGDNRTDFICVSSSATNIFSESKYYRNTGTPLSPIYTLMTGASDPFTIFNKGVELRLLEVADLDGDGLGDVIIPDADDPYRMKYFRNIGSPNNPKFSEVTGVLNPLHNLKLVGLSHDASGNYGVHATDLDGDGLIDLAAKTQDDGIGLAFYKNIGSRKKPVFSRVEASKDPLSKSLSPTYADAFADVDGDGRLDIVKFNEPTLRFFRNVGTGLVHHEQRSRISCLLSMLAWQIAATHSPTQQRTRCTLTR